MRRLYVAAALEGKGDFNEMVKVFVRGKVLVSSSLDPCAHLPLPRSLSVHHFTPVLPYHMHTLASYILHQIPVGVIPSLPSL
jgi:hypothetical protein